MATTSQFGCYVDRITESEWSELLPRFDDASLYQSWSYGAVCWGEKQLSHLVVKRGEKVVAMAQVRIVRLPVVGRGIAYVRWGPLWQLRDEPLDGEALHQVISALRAEYVDRRRLLLRMVPKVFRDDSAHLVFESACERTGFKLNARTAPYRTIHVDLKGSEEELRRRLDQKWRNQLNAAERKGLTVVGGTDDELFDRFTGIYREMMARKQFETTVDIEEFRSIQHLLPGPLKMQVLLCEKGGQLLAGLVGSALGDAGLYLLGATGTEGMKAKGSYLLQWRMMQLLRERGCRCYDLGGINPERNPGVYHFKRGISGHEVCQLNRMEMSNDWVSSMVASWGERLHGMLRPLNRLRPRQPSPSTT